MEQVPAFHRDPLCEQWILWMVHENKTSRAQNNSIFPPQYEMNKDFC